MILRVVIANYKFNCVESKKKAINLLCYCVNIIVKFVTLNMYINNVFLIYQQNACFI